MVCARAELAAWWLNPPVPVSPACPEDLIDLSSPHHRVLRWNLIRRMSISKSHSERRGTAGLRWTVRSTKPILATTQAIVEYRASQELPVPYIGRDTWIVGAGLGIGT